MNEMMIQEAVLNSIDTVDEAQLFAEFDVILSMAAVYEKSAMIQEQADDLSFDGYELIQEAKSEGDAAEPGKLTKYAEGLKAKGGIKKGVGTVLGWIGKALDIIMRGFGFIAGKLKSIFTRFKNKLSKKDIENLVNNGAKVKLDEEAQEAFDLPEYPTKEHFKRSNNPKFNEKNPHNPAKENYKAQESRRRAHDRYADSISKKEEKSATVSIDHVEIIINFNYHCGALVKAYEKLDEAATMLNDVFEHPEKQGVVDQFKKIIAKAKEYMVYAKNHGRNYEEPYSKAYQAYQEMTKHLSSAAGRINDCKKTLDQMTKENVSAKYSNNADKKTSRSLEDELVTVRACVSETSALVAGLTKEAANFYKYMDSVLNRPEIRAKAAAAMDEFDEEEAADERFGLK